MGRPIVRLKDVADKTGFSVNTVSLALRGSPRIPADTAMRIRDAARDLNYMPNQVAKSLVSRETKTIGLVLTDITNPALTQVAQSIELALAERGYSTLFATSNNDLDEEKRIFAMFQSRQVDGMLIYPRSHRDLAHIRQLRQANYPVVLLVADPDAGVDAVSVDERRGAYRAVRHLIDMGHSRIGIIDSANPMGNHEKRDGYVAALTEAGIEPERALSADPQGHSVIRGYWAMDKLMRLADRPTAVFTANDSLAIGALRWTQKNGLRVPEDVAIVGFDNIEFAEHAATPLTSVNYEIKLITDLAVARLIELIGNQGPLPDPSVTLIDPELIVRESTHRRS
ncbi:LacI family DNA-binding transcriptional regulator [Devosia salina]|uniref:LacI family transcriptional regulator n=1 Tax=Devosia salina TaxID=2860336 RepID=A0ABX8W9Z4_9HYPH|nr:LacI family DNA-binding transcriptional regulator [Devosia salina]QYO75521.1 LacI family transcriptional regulator [Devosia salina]